MLLWGKGNWVPWSHTMQSAFFRNVRGKAVTIKKDAQPKIQKPVNVSKEGSSKRVFCQRRGPSPFWSLQTLSYIGPFQSFYCHLKLSQRLLHLKSIKFVNCQIIRAKGNFNQILSILSRRRSSKTENTESLRLWPRARALLWNGKGA